jgi:hypothetical protein
VRHDTVKKIDRAGWYAIKAPTLANVKHAHEWCRMQESSGRFYRHYTNTRWWFEIEADAVLFALRWSGC